MIRNSGGACNTHEVRTMLSRWMIDIAKLPVLSKSGLTFHIPVSVRATAVGRDAERNAVLAGDPKGLDYYVILL